MLSSCLGRPGLPHNTAQRGWDQVSNNLEICVASNNDIPPPSPLQMRERVGAFNEMLRVMKKSSSSSTNCQNMQNTRFKQGAELLTATDVISSNWNQNLTAIFTKCVSWVKSAQCLWYHVPVTDREADATTQERGGGWPISSDIIMLEIMTMIII